MTDATTPATEEPTTAAPEATTTAAPPPADAPPADPAPAPPGIPEAYFLLYPENEAIIQGEARKLPALHAWLVFLLVLGPLAGLAGWLGWGAYTRWVALVPALTGGTAPAQGALGVTLAWTGWAVLAGVAALGMWLSALGVLLARRALQRRGQVAWGTVTEASGRLNGADNLRVTVSYRLRAPRRYVGELRPTLEGKLTRTRNDLKGQPLPAPGTPLPVLYLHPKNYEVL